MVQGKWFAPGEDISPLISVRESVFSRAADNLDQLSWNALIYEDGVPCAAGRIWYRDGAFWLGEIGVLESHRGRKLGDLTLRLLLYKAQSHSASEVRLRCPADTEGFFSRLGFHACSSTPDETEMMISGDRIDLDTCKNCPKTSCPGRK